MKKASRLIAGFAALGLSVSACGGDDDVTGANSGDQLTTTESLAVFSELQLALSSALTAPMAAAAAEPIPNTTADCPGGGSISISGDVNENGDNFTFSIDENINNCVVMAGGVTFTVNGDPRINISGDITINQSTFAFTGTFDMTGGFRYTSDDNRSGSCAMDVSFNFGTGAISGTICGNSVTG